METNNYNNNIGFLTFDDIDIKLNIIATGGTIETIEFVVLGVFKKFEYEIVKLDHTDTNVYMDILIKDKYSVEKIGHLEFFKNKDTAIKEVTRNEHKNYARNSRYTGPVDGDINGIPANTIRNKKYTGWDKVYE